MKRKTLFVLALLGLFTFLVGCTTAIKKDVDFSNTIITVDINPSIELKTDDAGLIVKVKPLNEDAAALLDEVELVGLTVDEALEVIVELASEAGYLDFDVENVILVSICKDGEKVKEAKKEQVKQKLEKHLKEKLQKEMQKQYRYGHVVVDKVEITDELKEEALELEISVGKLLKLKDLLEDNEEFDIEDIKDLSLKEILELLNVDNEEFQRERNKLKDDFDDWVKQDIDRKEEHEKKKLEKQNKEEKHEDKEKGPHGEDKKEDRPEDGEKGPKGEGNKEDRPKDGEKGPHGEGNKEDRPEKEEKEPKGDGNKEDRPEDGEKGPKGEGNKEDRPEDGEKDPKGEGNKEERPEQGEKGPHGDGNKDEEPKNNNQSGAGKNK